ncbi:hypothetical protein ACIPY0_12215 [Paenarthrobacter nicotinovorans]|uniref:DUF7426 family protein n=1 Tax=Paenarthrobacter nicotinovorans TaxID=29320 RepID=UPI0037F6AA4D
MALRPYEDVIGPLVIPYRGKEYPLPAVSLEDGLRMHAATANEEPLSLAALMAIIMGDTAQQMLDDKVPPAVVDRAFWAGVADFQQGREAAELVWENGLPKGVMEEVLQELKQAQTIPTAAASTTPPRASGNGTRNRKKKARRSRGK